MVIVFIHLQISKGHCKIAYDEEKQRLFVSDYYDFSSTYEVEMTENDEDDWEDVGPDVEIDEEMLEVPDSK